jgi:ATP-dependent DNA helicase RecQ
VRLPSTAVAPFTGADAVEVRALMAEGIRSLSTPRQVTRFLCGLTSPATTRAKLTRRREFGRFSAVPFRTVLEWVEGEFEV